MTRLNPFLVHQQAVVALLFLSTVLGLALGALAVIVSEVRR